MSTREKSVLGECIGDGKGSGEPDYDVDAVADAIIEEIERPQRMNFSESEDPLLWQFTDDRPGAPDDVSGGPLPEMDLPGFGDPYESCGDPRTHFCETCGDEHEIGRTCSRSTCMRCASSWILNRAGTSREKGEPVAGIVARLVKAAKMMSGGTGTSVKHHHIMISPDPSEHFRAEDPYQKGKEIVQRIAKNVWGASGASFYHPYRGDDEEVDDPGEGTRTDLNEWKDRVLSHRNWEHDVRQELDCQPHFHLVVAAPWVPGGDVTKQVYEETGWVIKRITKKGSKKSIDGMDDLARVVTYCLSHTGIRTNYGADGSNRVAKSEWGAMREGRVYPEDRIKADLAVRSEAPRTLGIPSSEIECKTQVPEEEQAENRVDAWQNTAPSTATSASSSTSTASNSLELATDGGTVRTVPCEGRLYDISQAPYFLSRDSFVDRIGEDRAHELQMKYDAWKAEQEQEDNPPPD